VQEVKRTEFIRRIRQEARRHGMDFELEREGAEHEMWRVAGIRVVLTRHVEVAPKTERRIKGDLESLFGKGWWR
jgi:hypothetical protein